jgi:hypothetical protein
MRNPLLHKSCQKILSKDTEESKLKDIKYYLQYIKVEIHQESSFNY